MRTLLPLEDALDNSPNMLSMLGLFEQDADNLWVFVVEVRDALKRVVDAHSQVANATQHLSQVLASFTKRDLPLDQAAYDVPVVMKQMENVCQDIASWMQLIVQQLHSSVQIPINKLDTELDALLGPIRHTFHEADAELQTAEMKHARITRKDTEQRLNQSTSDVFNAKIKYHKRALQYFTRLNALQFTRYTLVIEPLVAFMYTLKTFFNTGTKTLTDPKLSDFFSRTQEQMQTIHTEAAESATKATDVHKTIAELQRLDPMTIYSPELVASQSTPSTPSSLQQKQGYLFVKSRSLMSTKWDRYFMFTQGSHLMCQKRDDLAGELLFDLSEPSTLAGVVDSEERRFTFCIHTAQKSIMPSTERTRTLVLNSLDSDRGHSEPDGSPNPLYRDLRWKVRIILQARNEPDMNEWVNVINNLSHGRASRTSSPVKIGASSTTDPDAPVSTPPNSPDAKLHSLAYQQDNVIDDSNNSSSTVEDVSSAPIQFDFNGGSVMEESEDGNNEDNMTFEVQFVGSTQVAADRGDRVIYDTIQRIQDARQQYDVKNEHVYQLAVSGALKLSDNKLVRLCIPLPDISYWATHADDDSLFGLITRTKRVDDGMRVRSTFTCFVFRATTLSGSVVCDALTESTRAAFTQRKSSSKQPSTEEQPKDPITDSVKEESEA